MRCANQDRPGLHHTKLPLHALLCHPQALPCGAVPCQAGCASSRPSCVCQSCYAGLCQARKAVPGLGCPMLCCAGPMPCCAMLCCAMTRQTPQCWDVLSQADCTSPLPALGCAILCYAMPEYAILGCTEPGRLCQTQNVLCRVSPTPCHATPVLSHTSPVPYAVPAPCCASPMPFQPHSMPASCCSHAVLCHSSPVPCGSHAMLCHPQAMPAPRCVMPSCCAMQTTRRDVLAPCHARLMPRDRKSVV